MFSVDLLDGENGLMFADIGSNDRLCTGIAFGRSGMCGVFGANAFTLDKIDLRISLCLFAGVAVPFSSDDFFISVFGVAGVSNSLNARTLRYGGDSKCIFVCITVVLPLICRNGRNGRIIELPIEIHKQKYF